MKKAFPALRNFLHVERKFIPGRNVAESCLMLDELYACFEKSMLLATQHLPYYKDNINPTEEITTTGMHPEKTEIPHQLSGRLKPWLVNAKVFILQIFELSVKII